MVEIKYNHEPSFDELNTYDEVILAIGAHNMELPMPVEASNVVSSWDILNGKEVNGDCVVLGGGLVGTETAEYVASKGYKVTIVEMMDKIAAQESATVMPLIEVDFKKHGVIRKMYLMSLNLVCHLFMLGIVVVKELRILLQQFVRDTKQEMSYRIYDS